MEKYEILLALSEEGPHLPSTICWILEDKGYHVTATLGINPGMEMLFKKSFDLVITDLPAVIEKVKELNPESMAILMLTTGTRSILSIHAIRSAADDCVFIPFELAELEARVANCIEKLELKRKNIHNQLNEKIENLSKTLSYDIRGSLISMKAALELLCHGYYGGMDESVMSRLKDVLSKTVCLIGVTEECVGEAWSVSADLNMQDKRMSWVPDRLYPAALIMSRNGAGRVSQKIERR
jgi:response regulator RpfG family c-di-GMP phosphodiesterase